MCALGYPLTTHVYAPILQAYCASADIQAAYADIQSADTFPCASPGATPDVVIYIISTGCARLGIFTPWRGLSRRVA
jgi:hypothetical protein